NAQGEEYLTDVVNILANAENGQYRVGICEFQPDEILTYNNPEELVAVEEAFRRKMQGTKVEEVNTDIDLPSDQYRSVSEWIELFHSDVGELRTALTQIYGSESALCEERRKAFLAALHRFGELYGVDRKVI